jgi:hypothetical protein
VDRYRHGKAPYSAPALTGEGAAAPITRSPGIEIGGDEQPIRSKSRRLHGPAPALGAPLEASTSTGMFCSYRPTPTPTWTVEMS